MARKRRLKGPFTYDSASFEVRDRNNQLAAIVCPETLKAIGKLARTYRNREKI